MDRAPASEPRYESYGHLIVRGYIESIFDSTEPGQVFAVLNRFLSDFAVARSTRQLHSQLCPDQIGSAAELDSRLIPVRIEAQRQEAEPTSVHPDLLVLMGMLDAASRHIKTFAGR